MYDNRYEFPWGIPDDGFEWVDAIPADLSQWKTSQQGPYLVPSSSDGARRAYKPLKEHDGLCMDFARLPSAENAILDFANRYGPLGIDEIIKLDQTGGRLLNGESLGRWQTEIAKMRDVVEVREDVLARRHANLKKVIRWVKKEHAAVRFQNDRQSRLIASEDHKAEQFARLQWGRLEKPAMMFVQQVTNEQLELHTAPALLWGTDEELGLYYRPINLLGALWLQFALAITHGSEFRKCGHCKKSIEISPGAGRSDKQYCSDSCRVMASRARKRQERANAQP